MSPTSSLDVLARLDPPVRASLAERAATGESAPPATPLPAASVVLLREAPGGELQVYLMHRHARMAFAASMAAFPGGGMDEVDRADPAGDPRAACAIRETYEETGVRLSPEDLLPWAHWITPEPEPRRYDTYFYVAAQPAGERASDVSGETERAGWSTPGAALAELAAERIAMLPPTLSVLTELHELGDLRAVEAAATDREVLTVLPQVVRTATGWAYRYPRASS